MTKKNITFLITVLMFIVSSCSTEQHTDKGPAVAKIGSDYIYLYDVLTPASSTSFFRKGIEGREQQVSGYVMRKLYIKEGYSRGIDKKETVVKKMSDLINAKMVDFVFRGVVVDRFNNEKTRQELYDKLKKQVSARHILITYKDALDAKLDVSRSKPSDSDSPCASN